MGVAQIQLVRGVWKPTIAMVVELVSCKIRLIHENYLKSLSEVSDLERLSGFVYIFNMHSRQILLERFRLATSTKPLIKYIIRLTFLIKQEVAAAALRHAA